MQHLPALVPVSGLGLGAGATALAQGGGGGPTPYEPPEPAVSTAQVLHLASAARCLPGTRVTVRITPPPGAVLGWVRVRAHGGASARLTGVPRAAGATVREPRRGGRLAVMAETLGGRHLDVARAYLRCGTAPAPVLRGGGES